MGLFTIHVMVQQQDIHVFPRHKLQVMFLNFAIASAISMLEYAVLGEISYPADDLSDSAVLARAYGNEWLSSTYFLGVFTIQILSVEDEKAAMKPGY